MITCSLIISPIELILVRLAAELYSQHASSLSSKSSRLSLVIICCTLPEFIVVYFSLLAVLSVSFFMLRRLGRQVHCSLGHRLCSRVMLGVY